MATDCFCGAVFTTIQALHAHASSYGHLFECHCGTIVESQDALTNHNRHVSHTDPGKPGRYLDLPGSRTDPCKCGICINRSAFKDQHARDQHNANKHNACPLCAQVFKSTVDRLRHQKAATHCYCAEHDEAFNKPAAFAEHKRADVHISSFECSDCQRSSSSDKALDHHLVSEGHARVIAHAALQEAEFQAAAIEQAQLEEANLRCEACDKSFVHLAAFRQHKQSLRHRPLSELKCPMSSKCLGTFRSPSALLHHLELGGCKGGMTRNKLSAVVYQHDSDRHITSTAHANRVHNMAVSEASHASIAPGSSASNRARSVSVDSSHIGGGLATPAWSETGSIISPEEFTKARQHNVDDRHSSQAKSQSVETAAATDSSNDLNDDGGVVVTDCASVVSSGPITYTPPRSDTSNAKHGGGVDIASTTSTTGKARTASAVSSSGFSDGGVILTPPESMSGSGALSDWSFLNSSQIMTPSSTSVDGSSVDTVTFDAASQRWPCQTCPATFRKRKDLVQHMDSVVHAPKIFHCPTDLPGLQGSRKPTVQFKTLGGLAQHVEAGSCKGGKETLGFIVRIFEKQIQAKLGKSVKLLKE